MGHLECTLTTSNRIIIGVRLSILRFDSLNLVFATAVFSDRGPEFLEVGGVGGY